jgi:hypothetical protein
MDCITAYVLFIKSGTQVGCDYGRFAFPGMLIGSAGTQVVLTGIKWVQQANIFRSRLTPSPLSVAVMTAVPPSMAGVAGATLQTAYQIGSSIALAIQAGLLTVNQGGIHNSANVQASWYFEFRGVVSTDYKNEVGRRGTTGDFCGSFVASIEMQCNEHTQEA